MRQYVCQCGFKGTKAEYDQHRKRNRDHTISVVWKR